jgi:hypothetical protein
MILYTWAVGERSYIYMEVSHWKGLGTKGEQSSLRPRQAPMYGTSKRASRPDEGICLERLGGEV